MKEQEPDEGLQRTTFPDGRPSAEYTIKNGKHHGIYRRWHQNGLLAEQRRYRNGLLHGVTRRWNDRGDLLGTCKFNDGTGMLREWHDNGQVSYELSYFCGEMNGRMRWWAEDGMLYGGRYYFDGRPISKKGYLAKCKTIPGLPRCQDETATNTLGNYVRRLRRAKREQAKLGLTPEQLEEQRWFEEQCKGETKEKGSKELVSWLTKGTKQEKELGELSESESLKFARRLYALGAVKVWATNIERDKDGAEYSKRLIITLPDAPAKQGRIYALCASSARPFQDGNAPAIRFGKSYMSVSLM